MTELSGSIADIVLLTYSLSPALMTSHGRHILHQGCSISSVGWWVQKIWGKGPPTGDRPPRKKLPNLQFCHFVPHSGQSVAKTLATGGKVCRVCTVLGTIGCRRAKFGPSSPYGCGDVHAQPSGVSAILDNDEQLQSHVPTYAEDIAGTSLRHYLEQEVVYLLPHTQLRPRRVFKWLTL